MQYHIETFGCQMNAHDSERMAGLLEQAGYEPTDDPGSADIIILNTCSVRERAVEKLYSRLGEIQAESREGGTPPPLVAVAGCVAQQEGERLLKRSDLVGVVLGTQAIRRLPVLVSDAVRTGAPQVDINPYEEVSFALGVARRQDPVKAYVTIIEGCNDFCAFCVVPYTRGHERMRPKAEILAEIREAVDSGRKEVQLLGQIVNHYQAPDDPGCDFPGLLEAADKVPGLERIRFASPHPRHASPRLVEAIRDLPRVCKHIHLPVQSGSTKVLAAMRRRHTREDYLDLVARLRDAVPDLPISTDMIVGFPEEREADFEETLSLAAAVRFQGVFSFKYSVRPNTLAAKRLRDDVPEEIKSSRLSRLQNLQRDVQLGRHQACLGQVVEVLVDSVSRRNESELSGRTSGNLIVNFPGPKSWLGTMRSVRVVRAGPNSVRGEPVDSEGPGA